jgi:hypothetical protein
MTDRQESRTHNTGLAKVAVQCSADTFGQPNSIKRDDSLIVNFHRTFYLIDNLEKQKREL